MTAITAERFHRLPPLLPVLVAALGSGACAGNPPVVRDPGVQAYYQTAFPTFDASETLRRTFDSVRRIQILAEYDRYTFEESDTPVEGEPVTSELLRRSTRSPMPQERSATAVLLSRSTDNAAYLTADHALDLPDTIVRYVEDEYVGAASAASRPGSRRIESIAIKRQQTNWVVGRTLENFEVLARDPVRDLALIGVREPPDVPRVGALAGPRLEDRRPRAPVLALAAGDDSRLSWGSFVYVLGFPRGYPMVTRGIVSVPEAPTVGSFLVDGLWNRGMSGGLIVAVRGDGTGLEWVGIARSAASTGEIRLVPDEDVQPQRGVRHRYTGRVYVEEERRIDYGITLSVPVAEIRRFLDEHRRAISQQGFAPPRL